MGGRADLWFKDCPLAVIDGHMTGELHLPYLGAGETIRIGERLGKAMNGLNIEDECGETINVSGPFSEQSPRSYRTLVGEPNGQAADRGGIFLLEPASLHGQIIVNGIGASLANGWKGRVMVGADQLTTPLPTGTVVLDPQGTLPDQAPFYQRPSTPLGGGAVGLVPYHMFGPDCSPEHDPGVTGAGIKNTVLDGGAVVKIRFYGPIKRRLSTQTWGGIIKVRCRPFNAADTCTWVDASSAFNVYGPGVNGPDGTPWADPRAIGLKLKNGYHVAPGVYLIWAQSDTAVVCDGTTVTGPATPPAVVWDDICDNDLGHVPGYVFIVSGDCDNDNIPDHLDGDLSSCSTTCSVADFNHSGVVTVQDIFDFLQAYFAGCMGDPASPCNGANADINGVGGVTVQDIFDYLAAYFGCHA